MTWSIVSEEYYMVILCSELVVKPAEVSLKLNGSWRCLGEVSDTGSCLEGSASAGEGLEDDPIGVDVSTVGYVTSSEAMVDV